MILQTGMRTDIPAFYSEWFCNRIKEGYVYVRNPYNPQSVTAYRIHPDVVDLISFCTKNPAPMLEHMELLAPYGQYWFVTITSYGQEIEPGVPAKECVMEDFKRLSEKVGVDSVGWRYDPIFVWEEYTVERHIADFEQMARTLAGYTRTCVISFIDLYQKVRKNFPEVGAVSREQRLQMGKAFAEIGRKYDMTIKGCGEGQELAQFGVDCNGCMTLETFACALHESLNVPRWKPAREECACFLGNDIGAYNTCGHLCRYCYANHDEEIVRRNLRAHRPQAPLLIGNIHPEDTITWAKQESWRDGQMRLEFL
ncbi:MAG: DUF1848 domain-containing protein [Lachnospiraceae bacterium]|nr:DUF1848 domain-containing protein [Lachnospiraceae bacterium]